MAGVLNRAKEIAQAEEIKRLRKALRHYACPKNCAWEKTREEARCIVSCESTCGFTAREALGE